jgi:hypothetical protein
MSTQQQQQQQQQTAEKSVQTQDLSGSTTLLVTNNPVTHLHTENTAAEVANTLVSMATGRQRGTTVKQLVNKTLKSLFFFSLFFFLLKECHQCSFTSNNFTNFISC